MRRNILRIFFRYNSTALLHHGEAEVLMIHSLLKTFLSCAILLCGFNTNAQVKYLILKQKDGTQASFTLASNPVIECQNGTFIVNSSSGNISVSLSEIDSYVLSESPTLDIQSLMTDKPKLSIHSGTVIISGMKSNMAVSVYSVDGRLLRNIAASKEGVAVINLSDYAHCGYIIRAGNSSYKIVNK